MNLHPPFIITARLMAGVVIGGAAVSIGYSPRPGDGGRTRYHYHIDLAGGPSFSAHDLQSGVGGGNLQEGMESLLSFLGAAAESYRHTMGNGRDQEERRYFSDEVEEWAYENSDEIALLQAEIAETPNLIEE